MTQTLYRPELCFTSLIVDDANGAIHLLAEGLRHQGVVHDSFEGAVRDREASSPTGLPLSGRKVAIPHADPEHVIEAAIAVGTLQRPVFFQEMGNPDSRLEVDVVLMLALPDHESAQHELVHLVERCQDSAFVDRLQGASDSQALYALLSGEDPS